MRRLRRSGKVIKGLLAQPGNVAAHYLMKSSLCAKRYHEENMLLITACLLCIRATLPIRGEQVATVNRYLQAQSDFWWLSLKLDLGPFWASKRRAEAA